MQRAPFKPALHEGPISACSSNWPIYTRNIIKVPLTHKHTAAPTLIVYIQNYTCTQQALFTHAHAACPCLHVYKQQAPFKHARSVSPAGICMHDQQAPFTFLQAAGSVYIPLWAAYSPCLNIHAQQVLFVLVHWAGPDFTRTFCGHVYTYSRSGLQMHIQQVLFTHVYTEDSVYSKSRYHMPTQ